MNPLQFLYDTVDILKDGKTGKVYFVYDKVSKQPYILKERALKTAEIYSRLKEIKSPYLPEIYHAVEYDGKLFIVEEFIQGQTLYDILIYDKNFEEKKSAEILKQLCNALKTLHAQKIIHRDIKPSNIMLTKDNSVKLIDFSISRIEKENNNMDTDFLGTRGYAPPEQYGFEQTDSRSDIYSLGVTIQTILGENYDGYLKKILAKCPELNPANRYQSVEEIIFDVDKKYLQYKIKKSAVKIISVCAIIFVVLIGGQNFLDTGEISAPPVKVEEIKTLKTSEKVPPREKYEPAKIKWAEIYIPETENISTPLPSPISEIETFDDEDAADPRLNRICTLTLNGEIYNSSSGEIPKSIWQTWQTDGENIYLPQNFSVNLNLENKDTAPLEISVTANLKGLQRTEKIFTANLAAGQSKNFEIPLGGMACSNGSFEVEIWLKENNGDPLFVFWNGANISNKSAVRIFLQK